MKKNDLIELTIESLAFGGEGIGRYKTDDGTLAVFVEDTVPGDVVRVRVGGKKRNYAFAYVTEFLKRASNRIEPRCKHFGTCGGCRLQYLSYEDQLKIKEQQVRDALRRIGGFEEEVVLPIIGCSEPWFYRNKMDFSFSRREAKRSVFMNGEPRPGATRSEAEAELTLGLHVRRRHHDVIELEECFLLDAFVGDFVTSVRDFFREMERLGRLAELTPVSLVLRQGKHTGEIMVNLIFENGEPDFLEEFVKLIAEFFERSEIPPRDRGAPTPMVLGEISFPQKKLTSVYFTNILNKKGSPKAVKEKLLWGEPVIHEELHLETGAKLKFEISPQAFFQPNTRQAEVLYGEVLKTAGLGGQETVFDLFCGAGTIGSFCAHAAKKVYGIELNESAVKNARANAELNCIKNIEFIAGDVGEILDGQTFSGEAGGSLARPDIVIVDPPRGGLDPKTVKLAADLRAQKIVYVSCNPTSLARDLNLFAKTGYSLVSVQPVDMFPQTYHIECVALLSL